MHRSGLQGTFLLWMGDSPYVNILNCRAMKNLIIIGTGNFSKIVHAYALISKDCGKLCSFKGFVSTDIDTPNDKINIIDHINNYLPQQDDVFICAYVNGSDRQAAVETITNKGGVFINLIHPFANICESSVLGIGNIVGAFTTLSVDTVLGNHNIIQDHCNIGHDSTLGDFNHFYVGCILSGKNTVANNVSVFTGSVIYPKVKINDNAIIGAGSVVMRNVKPNTSVLGNPAKLIE